MQVLRAKNTEIEVAVEDLMTCFTSYLLDASVTPVSEDELDKLRLYYNGQMYQVRLSCERCRSLERDIAPGKQFHSYDRDCYCAAVLGMSGIVV